MCGYVRKADYQKSLKNTHLHKNKLPKSFYREMEKLSTIESAKDRRKILFEMTKIINKHFNIPGCGICIFDYQRPFLSGRANYWLKGLYMPNARGMSMIKIWNYSENNRRLSTRQIVGLWIHEWIHHADCKSLHIDVNHDSGFWKRLKHLRRLVFFPDL